MDSYRNTRQFLAPAQHTPVPAGEYEIYPGFPLSAGKIETGFLALARALAGQREIVIDGYIGVFWEHFRERLSEALASLDMRATWQAVDSALRPESEINELIAPFLGGDDPIFGRRWTKSLSDFFDPARLATLRAAPQSEMNILYGCGAALAGWDALLIYVDLPKNEIQFRSRAGSIHNLGASTAMPPKPMYKRFYYVDWIALNRHKADHLARIDIMVDAQRPDEPAMMHGDDLRAALREVAHSPFRVRPWFEPGPWGGQWSKEHIPQLAQDVPNYAWSFQAIVPENGLMFESSGNLLEVSFDSVMFQHYKEILGDYAMNFGFEFPLRFNYIDTFAGTNLSVQVHPRPRYIREMFGENFTQDETYYVLDCKPDARVYIGFQEDIVPEDFRAALEHSFHRAEPLDVDRYVNSEPADKHKLFLIPHGTIHACGVDNLVLEISGTTYLYTFKLYDWLRLDLDGTPRPINIERGLQNLSFRRKGKEIMQEEFIARPSLVNEGPDWRLFHLPTHPKQFYDVHRFEFTATVEARTEGSFHIMNLVEGSSVLVETENGHQQLISYAETFIVPAAAQSYRITNKSGGEAKVVRASMKREWFQKAEHAWLVAPPEMLPHETRGALRVDPASIHEGDTNSSGKLTI